MSKQNDLPRKPEEEPRMALPLRNIYGLLLGLLVVTLGFILLCGGGAKDPNEFNEAALFSFVRMVIAPLLICGGFAYEVVAILKVTRKKDSK